MGRKHCGKRRNCPLRAFLLFPHCFQKACFLGRQMVSVCGNGLICKKFYSKLTDQTLSFLLLITLVHFFLVTYPFNKIELYILIPNSPFGCKNNPCYCYSIKWHSFIFLYFWVIASILS